MTRFASVHHREKMPAGATSPWDRRGRDALRHAAPAQRRADGNQQKPAEKKSLAAPRTQTVDVWITGVAAEVKRQQK